MAGFREFVTGEVLTAANVDDFLMKQSVQKYADAAARDAALGTAVAGGNALREGMVAYLDDTNDVLKYDGSSWSSVGGLVAVKSAILTAPFTANINSGVNTPITGLSITHEVADASNKLIISYFVGASSVSATRMQVAVGVFDGSAFIGVGGVVGSRLGVGSGGRSEALVDATAAMPQAGMFVHTPGAGSKTYTLHAFNTRLATTAVQINRTGNDSNDVEGVRTASSLIIQEVRV